MFAICRIEKLKTGGNIGGLNSHLTRTMEVPNADSDLTYLNHRMVGSDNLNQDVSERLKAANITPRKNAVLAVEHLLTASPEFFNVKKIEHNGKMVLKANAEKYKAFKNSAVEWLNERYGKENVVNVTVHLDETTPHIHAVVVPIDANGKLNARQFFGGREKLRDLQNSYAEKMKPLGLQRGLKESKAKHTTLKEFYGALNASPEQIKAIRDMLRVRKEVERQKLNEALRQLQKALKVIQNINANVLAPKGFIATETNQLGYRPMNDQEKKDRFNQNKGKNLSL